MALRFFVLMLAMAPFLHASPSILIIGEGGREHALAWKARQSLEVGKIFVAPGNGGTAIEKGIENVDIRVTDIDALLDFAMRNQIDLTIVGPESAIAAGIVDAFSQKGLRCFGPSQKAAKLETSKAYAKEFMLRHQIPTARYASFTDFDEAANYIRNQPLPVVIKADGLASGKGVIIAQTPTEATLALQQIMIDRAFGSAGDRVVIEEYLEGEELTFIVITDGDHFLPFATSQDHKRLRNHDLGPNTGGMGAYSPVSLATPELLETILRTIIQPTIDGIREDGAPYTGFLYAGLMITKDGPKVLEYNCRLGDPEAEPLLMRLQSDLVTLCQDTIDHRLDQTEIQWNPASAVTVVLTTGSYPGSGPLGDSIEGYANDRQDCKIFHARTKLEDGKLVTAGGRVLCVTALGSNMEDAVQRVYDLIKTIRWPGMHYRTDIGYRELER